MNFSRQVALFKQAMQTEGNSGFHYLLTFLMMSISFILLFFVGLTGSGAKGLYMLSLISSVNVFFVTVATVSLFCTSVTEEKEHNTLGVLLMTGISPFGFLTGKLISRLYMVLKLILLQIPFIVFARTLGGLSMDQIMAHLVYFLAIVVVMSQVGMFFSIISQRSSAAIFFTSVTLLILGSFPCNDSASFMSYYFKIFETGFTGAVFSQPVFLLAVFSIVVFLSSIMLFSKSAFDEGSGGLSQEVSILKSAKRDRYKTNPIFEKDFRYLAGYRLGLVIRSVIAFLLAFSTTLVQFGDFAYPIAVGWMYCECIYYSQVMVKSEKKAATL
ncbi:MAG: hypothetical protein NE327_19315, partial [Lentisphaeraceae bacterium]|nr:hypothetical protein [Lentisphaeraceae bacterium]